MTVRAAMPPPRSAPPPPAARGLERIRTERMCGRRLMAGDEADLGRILTDPRVARMLFPHGPPARSELAAILARHVAHWDRHGFGLWLMRDAVSGAVVGRGGLLTQRILGRELIEVGWAIVPERWGEGLATELGRAAVRIAWERLELTEVVSFTRVDNGASRRVMEKAGLAFERTFVHAGLPHALYRARRSPSPVVDSFEPPPLTRS